MEVRLHVRRRGFDGAVNALKRAVQKQRCGRIVVFENVKSAICVKRSRVVATERQERLRAPLAAVGTNVEMKVNARVLVREVILRAPIVPLCDGFGLGSRISDIASDKYNNSVRKVWAYVVVDVQATKTMV
jgi:hypothetical protein